MVHNSRQAAQGRFLHSDSATGRETGWRLSGSFIEIYGNVHELPEGGPFPYERGLQEFFEKHLRTLTGVEFLDSEYSTGKHHSRRIDTLGIDGAGRPVVVEYKRRQDENVINQGLDYIAWLEDHRAEFRELVREKLGDGRVRDIDFGTPRLLCVAGEFLRQDQIAAQNSRRRIELLRYRRYGDAYVALEWVYGGEAVAPAPQPAVSPSPCHRQRASRSCAARVRIVRPRRGRRAGLLHLRALGQDQRGDPHSVPRAQDVGGIVGQRANGRFQE